MLGTRLAALYDAAVRQLVTRGHLWPRHAMPLLADSDTQVSPAPQSQQTRRQR
jgi:hypothetical protein